MKSVFLTSGVEECYASVLTAVYERHLPKSLQVQLLSVRGQKCINAELAKTSERKKANIKGSEERDELREKRKNCVGVKSREEEDDFMVAMSVM